MASDTPGGDTHRDRAVSRRRALALAGGALATGLAGCSEVTDQSFSATPVRLPEAVRQELGLAETFTDASTTTRERTVGGQTVEVTITSQFAGYTRTHSPGTTWATSRPTLVERFTGFTPESPPGSGSAINAVASDLGLGAASPEFVEGDATVSGDRITLVVPERAREDGAVALGEVMALHHAEALGVDQLTSSGGNNYLVGLPEVLPSKQFLPSGGRDHSPDERWVAGHEGHWLPDDPSSMQCVVCLGERSPGAVFGVDEMPGRRVEAGESVDAENTILFMPAPKEYPQPDEWVKRPARVFNAGYPTPMGGPTYSLGVIATPNAEMAGEPVNPVGQMSGTELLTSEVARGMLADAGLTDADQVEWVRGPEKAGIITNWSPADSVSVLGADAGLESHLGIVAGQAGNWAVAVHLAKATPDDVVIPLAMHRRPAGDPGGVALYDEGDRQGYIDRQWTTRALEFTTEVVASLEATEGA